jgi:hypothetical protein
MIDDAGNSVDNICELLTDMIDLGNGSTHEGVSVDGFAKVAAGALLDTIPMKY